jgi:uncharacterized FlaG/YvyC family protein
MSSIVNLNILLVASTGLLPHERLLKVFDRALVEVNGSIQNGILNINNQRVGKVYINNRIVVQTYSEYASQANTVVEGLRTVFNRKAEIEIQNYQDELNKKKQRLIQEQIDLIELEKKLKTLDNEIQLSNKAVKKQAMSSCEAMVVELKDAATNQGYCIVEEKTTNGMQIQFVRRDY